MPDNLTMPFTGSGDATGEILTDEIDLGGGTGHAQYVKLLSGADGATATLDAAGGAEAEALRVTLADGGPLQDVFGTDSLIFASGNDAIVNTQDTFATSGFNYVFNGTTWDRMREGVVAGSLLVDGTGSVFPITAAALPLPAGAATAAAQLADGHNVTVDNASIAVTQAADIMLGTDFSDVLGTASLILSAGADDLVNTTDSLVVSSLGYSFDGSTWDRWRSSQADGVSGAGKPHVSPMYYNGATYDRARGSAADGLLVNTELPAAVALADDVVLPTTSMIGVVPYIQATDGKLNKTYAVDDFGDASSGSFLLATSQLYYNGASWDRMRGDTSGLHIHGPLAHDAGGTGVNPALGGALALDLAEAPTAVAKSDLTRLHATRDGQLWVMPGHPNTLNGEYFTTAVGTNDVVIAAPGVGSRIVLTYIDAVLGGEATVFPKVRIGFGSAVPTEPTTGNSVEGMALTHPAIPAGSGKTKSLGGSAVAIGGDNEPLRITNEVPTGDGLKVDYTYFVLNG